MAERISPGTYEWELLYADHAQRYEFFAHLCKGRHVLDAACGVGFGSQLLSKAGAESVCGVDRSEEALTYARTYYNSDPRVRFISADCEALESLDQRFDALLSFETIEHLRWPGRFVEGARKVIRPGGLFVCSTPNILRHSLSPKQTFVNRFHLSEMHYADFEGLVSKHFTIQARYHQTESPAYLRHQDIANSVIALQNSTLLRLESALRKLFGKEPLRPCSISGHLQRSVAGDYLIEPLDVPGDWQKTYIVVGTPK